MAISLIGTPQSGSATVDSDPIGSAIAVLTGDVVHMAVSQRFGNTFVSGIVHGTSTATATVSTILSNLSTGNAVSLSVVQYVVTGAGNLVVAPNFDIARQHSFLINHFRGVNASSPLVGSAVTATNTATTTFTGAAATPGKAGDVVVGFAAGPLATQTMTATSTWTVAGKRDGISDSTSSMISDFKEAPDTSALTSAPTISGAGREYRHTAFVLNAAPDIIPGTTVARGLYL